MTAAISEAIHELAQLAGALGVKNINEMPGCWEHQIDDLWWIAFNGHKEAVECSAGVKVDPFNCYVKYNGWPAGIIGLCGGIIAAGEAANEDSFIEALKAARERSAPCAEDRITFMRAGITRAIETGRMLPWWRTTVRQTISVEREAKEASVASLDELQALLDQAEQMRSAP